MILTNTTFGSTATYQCNEGFNLIGHMQRICQSNGEWSGNEPTCEGNHSLVSTFLVICDFIHYISVADCGFLMDPENGVVTINGRTFGSTATYQCDEGFNLVGNETRICQENGEWSDSQPTCESQLSTNFWHVCNNERFFGYIQSWGVKIWLLQQMDKLP